MKSKLFIGMIVLAIVGGFCAAKGFAEPICDTHTGTPCCESGCFEWVGEENCTPTYGATNCWDNIDASYENPWQYAEGWGGFVCLAECPNEDPEPFEIPENECFTRKNPFDGEPCWEVYVQTDFRNYHDSAQYADQLHTPGGYKLGFAYWNYENDSKVEFINEQNRNHYIVQPQELFTYLGVPVSEYLIWLGHDTNASGTWTAKVDGNVVKAGVTIPMHQPKLPYVKIHRMSPTPNGTRVVFSAPLTVNFTHIRLRVFDSTESSFIWEARFNEAGKTLTIMVPSEVFMNDIPYSTFGNSARFEYRASDVEGTCGGCVRTVTKFTLPQQ